MLKQDVVFVLGAGFSAELGMPLGNALKAQIAELLPSRVGAGDRMLRDLCVKRPRFNWLTNAEAMRKALPFSSSIDALVEHRKGDDDFVTLAKWAIARAISIGEVDGPLGKDLKSRRLHPEPAIIPESAYHALFRLIMAGVPRERVEIALSRLKVVTFNYDRTLELFLKRAVMAHSHGTAEHAAEAVAHATILHAYGSLGTAGQTRTRFSEVEACEQIMELAEGIRTFSETTESESLQAIRALIGSAGQIVFLGCAFHQPNLALIRPPVLAAAEVYGTVYVPAPPDPSGLSAIPLGEFAEPLIEELSATFESWADPIARAESPARHFLRAMTIGQLMSHYGHRWVER